MNGHTEVIKALVASDGVQQPATLQLDEQAVSGHLDHFAKGASASPCSAIPPPTQLGGRHCPELAAPSIVAAITTTEIEFPSLSKRKVIQT